MNRIEKLSIEIEKIILKNKKALSALEFKSPRGGHNARFIQGWKNCGNAAVTRAAKIAQCPTLNYWSGSAPTPSTAIPFCISEKIFKKYSEIFNIKN
jgi:hypothetical protein